MLNPVVKLEKASGQRPVPASPAYPESVRHAFIAPLPGERATGLICALIRDHSGHDFSRYKAALLQRCIAQRMNLLQITDLRQYIRILQNTPAEIAELFQSLLIGVTRFFRDPDCFDALRERVITALLPQRPGHEPLCIWVCGCGTGEEAYSIAILVREVQRQTGSGRSVRIFATDIDKRALERARRGCYPARIAADIPPRRLKCYFTPDPEQGGYRIRREIQDLLVFFEHNALNPPPFSQLDLIICRNLLIYMNSPMQQKLIETFHAALKPRGFLFIGASETAGNAAGLFMPLSCREKLFQRR